MSDHNADECKRFAGERELVQALRAADWSGVSIGNKALIAKAIETLAAAQPAPVVPEEADTVDAPWMSAETEPEIAWRDGFNACRARWIAAAPAQGQQVECQECERWRKNNDHLAAEVTRLGVKVGQQAAELSALKAQQSEDSDTVRRICDLFGIGSKARTQAAIMANVENTHKFARMLDSIEAEFFMVPGEIDPEYPDDQPYDCLVNRWSSTPEQYVEQFRAALETLKAQQVGQEPVGALKHIEQIRLWFFRDLSDTQRLRLFSLCGWPAHELTTHSAQGLVLRKLLATPQPAPAQDVAGPAVPALTDQEAGDLREFHEAVCCDAGHRVEKDGMRRLAEIGAVESVGFGRHRLTEFGVYLLAALAANDKQSGGA